MHGIKVGWLVLLGAMALTVPAGAQTPDELFRDAEKYYQELTWDRAIDLYGKFVVAAPNDARVAEASYKRLFASTRLGRDPKVDEQLEAFADANRRSVWGVRASVLLAGWWYQRERWNTWEKIANRYEMAIADFKALIGRRPLDVAEVRELTTWRFAAAQVYREWYDDRAKSFAVSQLQAVIDSKADTDSIARAWLLLGEVYRERFDDAKKYEAALQVVVKEFGDSSSADNAMFQLAELANAGADYPLARTRFLELRRRWPKSELEAQAAERVKQIEAPELDLEVSRTHLPGAKIPYHFVTRNLRGVTFNVYSVDPFALREFSTGYLGDLEPLRKAGKLQKTWRVAVADQGKYEYHPYKQDVPVSGVGMYVLEAVVDGKPDLRRTTLLNVSSLVLVQQYAAKKLVSYVADRVTHQPVADVSLRVLQPSGTNNQAKLRDAGSGRTNADGQLTTTVDGRGENGDWRLWTIGQLKGQYVFQDDGLYAWWNDPGVEFKAYIYTDRPVYRPENKVQFKAIVRTEREGVHTNVPNRDTVVTIHDPRGKELFKQTLRTDAYGSLSGDLALEKEPTLGVYTINVQLGKQAGGGQFRVEEYRKPEFKVVVGKPLAEVRPGGAAAVPITSTYYFGAPVAGGEVKFVVKRRPHYQYYWWRGGEWDWFYAGWQPRPRFYGGEQVVTEGTVKTDDQGKAIVEFTTLKDGNDYTYSIEAEVADVTRRVVEASDSLTVTQRGFYLYAKAGQSLYKPSDKVTVTVKAQNADEEPVKTHVAVDLWQMKWIPATKDAKTGRITTAAYYLREKKLWTQTVDTDPDSGEKRLVFDAPKDGYWEVGLRAPDTFDPKADVVATGTFWVASDAFKGVNYDHANLQLLPERDLYKKGDTARLLLNSPVRDGAVFLTIGATHIYETQTLRFTGNSLVLNLLVKENWSPNVYLNAVIIGTQQIYMANAEIKVPPTDRMLQVAVKSDKAEYKPRTSGTFEVTTTDQNGKPVAAQVSLGITDDSVYAIQEEMAGPIGVFFHGGRRGNQIRTAISFERSGEYDENMLEKDAPRAALGLASGGRGGMAMRRDATKAGAPPPSPSMVPMSPAAAKPEASADKAPGGAGGGEEPVAIRSFFPDTILWQPAVMTGADGKATVKLDFPDSLTTWRATARALTKDTLVGQQVQRVVTTKDLICRLQAPRFFTQLDESTISVVATNKTSKQQQVAVTLLIDGLEVVGGLTGSLTLEPNGQARLDRVVRATKPGKATITATVRGPSDSDGVKLEYVVLPHGADKFAAASGQVEHNRALVSLNLPQDRRDDATKLTVSLQPSVVNTLVDALPYLVQYPYGCVEQTTSKFLPCVYVARTLDLVGRPSTAGAAARKPQQVPEWWHEKGLEELPEMVKTGVSRLMGMQNADGGFGWFGGMRSDVWMSAYVVHGLTQAALADFTVPRDNLQKAVGFLYDNLHLLKSQHDSTAYVAWVLTETAALGAKPTAAQKQNLDEAVERVWAGRDELNDYTRALLILAMSSRGDKDRAAVVWRNLQARRIETEKGCHWGENRWGWRWSEDQVETTAFALLASQTVEPDAALSAKTAQWLVLNRTGNQWYSTKDTSAAIMALAAYADQHKELAGSYTVTVRVNGKDVKGFEVTPQNALSLKADVQVDPALLHAGPNDVEVVTDGKGAPYFSAMLEFYTKEDPIKGASNLISATRKYYRVTEYTDAAKQRQTKKELLANGDAVNSGDQVEVEVTVDAENDFSYVAFRDPKPAGCEPVDLTSGGTWGGTSLYRELRDKEVTFFADHLPQGKTVISYRLRAESPGAFRALPHNGFAMYRPDVRCLSDESILKISERPAG